MTLIALTEVMKDGAGTKRQPIWINPEIIATITTSALEKDTIPLIGVKQEQQKLTFLEYRNGRGSFVAETPEEVVQKISLAYVQEKT